MQGCQVPTRWPRSSLGTRKQLITSIRNRQTRSTGAMLLTFDAQALQLAQADTAPLSGHFLSITLERDLHHDRVTQAL